MFLCLQFHRVDKTYLSIFVVCQVWFVLASQVLRMRMSVAVHVMGKLLGCASSAQFAKTMTFANVASVLASPRTCKSWKATMTKCMHGFSFAHQSKNLKPTTGLGVCGLMCPQKC